MKLTEDLGMKRLSGQKAVRYGLFECPLCGAHVEKMMSNGKKAKSCGQCEKPRLYMPGERHLTYKCAVCERKYVQQKRLYESAKWKDRCSEHRYDLSKPNLSRTLANPSLRTPGKPTKTCPDCGKLIWIVSTKCKSCAQKLPANRCVDCDIEIHKQATRCKPCFDKLQDRGLSKERIKFQNSRQWADLRAACFERDKFTCQCCGKRGGYLHAHHIRPYRSAPELRLAIFNLTTLCDRCHYDLHAREVGEERWNTKLTEAIVCQILEQIIGGASQAAIADEYEISQSTVSHIRSGRTWHTVYETFKDRLPPPLERPYAANTKLTLAQAQEMRQLFEGQVTRRRLAEKFGVSRSTVSRVLRGEVYSLSSNGNVGV